MSRRSARTVYLATLLLLAIGLASCAEKRSTSAPPLDTSTGAFAPLDRPVSYEADVKPVLENRCVVCHACYDAPCQLVLSSHEGAERGATQNPVYDSSRLKAMEPTRLFVDEQSTAGWRTREFFPVLAAEDAGTPNQASLLVSMLALGHAHPFAQSQPLPETVELDIDRKLSCPTSAEFGAYASEQPDGGMPYGMAPLRDQEIQTLASWVSQQSPAPAALQLDPRAQDEVARWEAFLNGDSLKERITARYLYEHWFLAHLSFDTLPSGPFFEVVRSRSGPGQPIDVIATVRPYDDPGVERVYYRLRPIHSSIVHKTHIVYPLGDAKLARLHELFLASDWQPTRLPGYSREEAANPFVAFEQVPPRSRYQYLLDDAQYFVMTFIRGPVCRGQIAVDVIEDQFWVAFVDPSRDPASSHPTFLKENMHLLDLPAEDAGKSNLPGAMWFEYNNAQRKYMIAREQLYDEIDPQFRGPTLDWIWDGDQRNHNALLTVFRNFDNAAVVKGFVGDIPKTAWVMDYPIFERIYYNLVAGFDIFGSLKHQVATRLYMDDLRMQSENLFLGFLPADRRKEIRASWYIGATRQIDYTIVNKLRTLEHGTQIQFDTPDVKAELLLKILAQAGGAAGPPDPLNRCEKRPCDRPGASDVEVGVERELQRIASVRAPFVHLLPEVSFVLVRVDSTGQRDLVYALVHNVAHTNVAFMFGEDKHLIPEDDTLTLVPGHFGSYPNFFFEVDAGEMPGFVDALLALGSETDFTSFVERHGIRRTSPRFWQTSDWLRADLLRREPTGAGIYDLDRYENL